MGGGAHTALILGGFAAYLACWRLIMAGNAWTFRRRGERRLAP